VVTLLPKSAISSLQPSAESAPGTGVTNDLSGNQLTDQTAVGTAAENLSSSELSSLPNHSAIQSNLTSNASSGTITSPALAHC
jgi:hypothetical protein